MSNPAIDEGMWFLISNVIGAGWLHTMGQSWEAGKKYIILFRNHSKTMSSHSTIKDADDSISNQTAFKKRK